MNFEQIRQAIDSAITTNGNQEITGAVMNSILKQMIDVTESSLTSEATALGDALENAMASLQEQISANADQIEATKDYVDGLVGDINTILDSINGEEI